MQKITKQSDLKGVLNTVSNSIAAYSSVEKFKSLTLINLESINFLSENLLESAYSGLTAESELFDFLYVAGLHGAGKQRLARGLADRLGRHSDVVWLDWRANRDRYTSRAAPFPDINTFYAAMREIERAQLAYVTKALSFGQSVIFSDCGLNKTRRKYVLDSCGVTPYNKHCGVIVLLPKFRNLYANNLITKSYWERNKTYDEYFASTNFSLPDFSEGFRSIIFLNETERSDENYVSNEEIHKMYITRYDETQLKIKQYSFKE